MWRFHEVHIKYPHSALQKVGAYLLLAGDVNDDFISEIGLGTGVQRWWKRLSRSHSLVGESDKFTDCLRWGRVMWRISTSPGTSRSACYLFTVWPWPNLGLQVYSSVKEMEGGVTLNKEHIRSLSSSDFFWKLLSILSSLTWLTLSSVFLSFKNLIHP